MLQSWFSGDAVEQGSTPWRRILLPFFALPRPVATVWSSRGSIRDKTDGDRDVFVRWHYTRQARIWRGLLLYQRVARTVGFRTIPCMSISDWWNGQKIRRAKDGVGSELDIGMLPHFYLTRHWSSNEAPTRVWRWWHWCVGISARPGNAYAAGWSIPDA